MNDEMLLVELKEWCERRIAESKIENGYYKKIIEVLEENIKKLAPSPK